MADNPRDVGKTSGGGSLGHDQPSDVTEQTPIRNQANERPKDKGDAAAEDRPTDPVMPSDDSTLNTKI